MSPPPAVPQGPALRFAPAGEEGAALPRAVAPAHPGEPFVTTPRPAVPLRWLIIAWRRYRRAQRAGPKVEVDLAATMLEKCRRGLLTEPVLAPARRNQARLLALVDASPSMTPWASFGGVLRQSLAEGALAWHQVLFFENVPRTRLYETPGLLRPVPLELLRRDHGGCPLLIFSDAGAARGWLSRRRIEATHAFLEAAAEVWQPIAWLNPMPRRRWTGASAERIAQSPRVGMVELSEDGIVHAVDILRGLRGTT